jgi:hypothetical protein
MLDYFYGVNISYIGSFDSLIESLWDEKRAHGKTNKTRREKMTKRLKVIGFFSAILVWGALLSAGPVPAGPLDEIISGAKKEGTLQLMLSHRFPVLSMKRLEMEIK